MIDTQPLNQVDINGGQDATFTVMASGVMLVYQWLKDGETISDTENTYSGTTSETLTVLSVDLSDEGVYSVIIANNANILSAPARLTVCKLKHVLIILSCVNLFLKLDNILPPHTPVQCSCLQSPLSH